MSNRLQEALSILAAVGLVTVSAAIVALPFEWARRSNRNREKPMAIRTYARRIGRLLRARYGLQENYTPAQVKGMLKEWGYSTRYDCYGLAMYCDCADFMDYHRSIGESCNYEAMRYEISHYLFQSDTTFSLSDVIEAGVRMDHDRHHDYSDEYHSCDHEYGRYDGGGDGGGD